MNHTKNTSEHISPTRTSIDRKLGRYECIENGHSKFWECLHYSTSGPHSHKFLIRWGRIGAKKPQNMFIDSIYALEGKIREKISKGYNHIPGLPVTAQEYDKMLIEKELSKEPSLSSNHTPSKKKKKM